MSNQFLGRADAAVKLETARTIFGRSFDGTANVGGQALVYGTGSDTNRYSSGGLQVRESALVGNTDTDDRYAPRIGFHWANHTGANLIMTSSGRLKFTLSSDEVYADVQANSFIGALQGNATSATTATTAATLNYFQCTSNVSVGAENLTSNALGYVQSVDLLKQTDGMLIKQSYSSALAFELYGDYRSGALASRGRNNGTWTEWNNIVSNRLNYIPAPIGAEYIGLENNVTGALQVRLPIGFTNCMMQFTIEVFQYARNQSSIYHVAGYNYSSGWTNYSAYSTGYFNTNYSNLRVSFCKDANGYAVVCIGGINTPWNYPQVVVRDVLAGYGGSTYKLQQGWDVSFVTTMPTVQGTVDNPANWYNSYNAVTAGSATNAQQLGGVAAANYLTTSDTLILAGTI